MISYLMRPMRRVRDSSRLVGKSLGLKGLKQKVEIPFTIVNITSNDFEWYQPSMQHDSSQGFIKYYEICFAS